MNDEVDSHKVEYLLAEILKWIRIMGAKEAGIALATALDSDQKRLVYHLSDGTRGSVEIANIAHTSDRTVRRYWESWSRQGIMDSMRVRGGERFKKTFALEDFGIQPPSAESNASSSPGNDTVGPGDPSAEVQKR